MQASDECVKMDEKTQMFRIYIISLFIRTAMSQIADSTIALQDQTGICSSIWNPSIKILQERDSYTIVSHTFEQAFYQSDRNCVTSIIGKPGYQWSITVTKFDVDGVIGEDGKPIKCNDFLKIYDAERCDNAKLVRGIDFKTGLCGTLQESQIGNLLFSTCANKVTFQFKTDTVNKFKRGFTMELRQFKWSNPTGGPDCDPSLNGIAPNVWRDGTNTEFQNSWDEQPIIPGMVPGGVETDYDKEVIGIQCYVCTNCPVEPFDPERDNTAISSNCFKCSKEWDEEYQRASRRCYSRRDYLNKIDQLDGIDSDFDGCHLSTDEFARNINHCFCSSNLCNTGTRKVYNLAAIGLTLLLIMFNKYVL